jgi:GNAT superfamily N-acetyltransferase
VDEVEIRIVDVVADADVRELEDAVSEFNMATTGYRDGRSLSCFLRDNVGRLYAGIDGFTWGGYAHVEYLWVDEARRGDGLGSRLLRAAEAEATRRGCRSITLDTHEFQAPAFYARLGYEVVGTTVDTPVGHRQFFLQKALVD